MSTNDVDNRIQSAQDLLRQGKVGEAEQIAKQIGHTNPGLPASLLAIEVEEAKSDLPKALEFVEAALARNGENALLLLKRAQLLLNLRRRSEAFDVADRAAELAGPDPRLLLSVALIYHQMSRQAARFHCCTVRSSVRRTIRRSSTWPASTTTT